ncbi:MAG: DUF2784 domain-containing protein [Burkholderiales bacterium]|nr:MAG: DUF2784 domain-containing protein [Burkholderiales bacterium]
MLAGLAADALVLVHFGFIVLVVAGGLPVLRWPRLAWVHLPIAAWGALIEFGGWICPLTPLELRLRAMAGQHGYTGDFVAHYLLPLIYPDQLTRSAQIASGLRVVAINLVVYGLLLRRLARRPR